VASTELLVITIGVPLLLIIWRVARYDREQDLRSWSAAYGVAITAGNAEFLRGYLRTGRRLRFVCSLAGLLLPPLVSQAVDPSSRTDVSFFGLVVGYMVGSLWAELALVRPSGADVRVATLSPRRLEEYLPGRLRWGLWVVAGLALVLSVAGTVVDEQVEPAWSFGGPPVLLIGVCSILLAAAVEAAQRWILRRPQPFVSADLVAADDAVRSSSIHALAGSGICCLLLLLAGPAFVLANSDVQLLRWTMPWVGLGSFLGALISLRYYVYRAWRVRRPAPLAIG
jgi:hypothetical protein